MSQTFAEKNIAHTEKSKAALSSVLWSALLTSMKVAAGLATNSLGMLSEALHSALDFLAAGITFFAVRIAAAPADNTHPFGHGKIEHISALAETALLFITCGWIIREAVDRLFFNAAPVIPTWWAFAVIIISLLVDVNRSAMLRRVAKKHRSQALEADALHFTTDIWSSAVVLLGLIGVSVAPYSPEGLPRALLEKTDAMAALGVAFIVLGVSWNLGKRAIIALMDGGGGEKAQAVRRALLEEAPTFRPLDVRVRESGAQYFVDLSVEAPASMRVDAAHEVSCILEDIAIRALSDAEETQVHVHIEPASPNHNPNAFQIIQNLAVAHSLQVHGLALLQLEDGLHIFFHIELDPAISLALAHPRVDALEKDIIARVGACNIISHIEPLERQTSASIALDSPLDHGIVRQSLHALMDEQQELFNCHDLNIWTMGNHTALSMRCCASPNTTVAVAHKLASKLESGLRELVPGMGRITIHVEPGVKA